MQVTTLKPVASSRRQANMMTGQILIPGGKISVPPEGEPWRSRELVDDELRAAINENVAGLAPWPLFIYGETGNGKTCAALAMCDLYGGWYTTEAALTELVTDAKMGRAQTAAGYSRSLLEVWRDWSHASLCILDDIGTRQSISDARYEVVKNAIDKRQGKPLVVTSNLPLSDIAKIYDDRIASRLHGGSRFHLKTEDQRTGKCWKDSAYVN